MPEQWCACYAAGLFLSELPSMTTIWKYELLVADDQSVEMPLGAQLLTVQTQAESPCLWALVDPAQPMSRRRLRTFGTGHPVSEKAGRYVGTYQLADGTLVFHVFDSGEESST